MTHTVHRLSRLASVSALALALAAPIGFSPIFATPAQAFLFGGGGRIVYDPRNHAENILSAARALEQINNQITQLQNEAQMLMNQARNLASLPSSRCRRCTRVSTGPDSFCPKRRTSPSMSPRSTRSSGRTMPTSP